MMNSLLFNAFTFLAATVVFVPLARKLGLGSVLGYLAAGIAVGPFGLRVFDEPSEVMQASEFGIVLLLFVVGLELSPKRLWELRVSILGLGSLQIVASTILFTSLIHAFLLPLDAALICGFGFSLSSTAIALQMIGERGLLRTPAGRHSFSVLLAQDLAVIPVLAIVPLLFAKRSIDANTHPWWVAALAIVGIVVVGKILMRPMFHFVAKERSREVFTAAALMMLTGVSLLMESLHLSMALGSFLGGVMLANSEYRHELEANIDPFKSLLMGLFFSSVGMSIDFDVLFTEALKVVSWTLVFVILKFCLLFAVVRFFQKDVRQNILFATLLAQAGEFAFVLFSIASSAGIMEKAEVSFLSVVVALSMTCTPFLLFAVSRLVTRFKRPDEDEQDAKEVFPEHPIIVAGFGRFGQIVVRLLRANQIPMTIIDHSHELLQRVKRFGLKAYYGDATRLEILEAAGIERAEVLVLAMDNREQVLQVAELVRNRYPQITIVARAWDLVHAHQLLDRGVTLIQRETFHSAVELGTVILQELGYSRYRAHRAALKFKKHERDSFYRSYSVKDDEQALISNMVKARQELEKAFEGDLAGVRRDHSEGW